MSETSFVDPYRLIGFAALSVDKALTFSPTYGMYDVSASINDVELIKQPLVNDFQISLNQLQPYLDMEDVKIIFVCSPNNPTGNCFENETIQYILDNFNGMVIIDEAYIDFSSKASFITNLAFFHRIYNRQ